MSILAPEVSGKRLALLEETVPRLARVAVLWNGADPGKAAELRLLAEAGALMSYGANLEMRPDSIQSSVEITVILRSGRVESWTQQPGLTIPSSLLARADEGIDP